MLEDQIVHSDADAASSGVFSGTDAQVCMEA